MKPAPAALHDDSVAARTARLVRAAGVLAADGTRRVVMYMHGGAFLNLWREYP